jgi:POT family proton-dependent oligopeptide transporter
MYFFAAFALLAAAVFGWYAKRYKMVDHYRSAVSAKAPVAARA